MTKLRGARSQIQGRFESEARSPYDDGWTHDDEAAPELKTTVTEERARSIISRNESPDIPFEQSINAYRGCEHGCIYCYARPTHAYLELSPGLDFESKLFAKTNAVELLKAELGKRGYQVTPLAFGTNTDCYQPIERKLQDHARPDRGARRLRPSAHHRHQVGAHRARYRPAGADGDEEPGQGLRLGDHARPQARAHAGAARGEPVAPGWMRFARWQRRASPAASWSRRSFRRSPTRRWKRCWRPARPRGATMAGWILLRLPNEVRPLFKEWLAAHQPQRAEHVISIIRQSRGGRENDPNFGSRMTGSGNFVELIDKRFELACRRLGLNSEDNHMASRGGLDCSLFKPPAGGGQLGLF
jgi:DNA repair photolyase